MKLLTKEIINKLPKLYANDKKRTNIIPIIVKFFCPWNQWTWYATEYDGENEFFGYVRGDFDELGYFTLSELESVTGPLGLKIERDLNWNDKITLSQVIKERL